jgi:NAD(P)H-hydrate epimerase
MNCRIRPLSRQEVRELDVQAANDLALPTLILMENAGRGAAVWLAELAAKLPPQAAARPFSFRLPAPVHQSGSPRFLILCGPGNNGGDGGVVARHLDAWGFTNRTVWFTKRELLRGDAETQWKILDKSQMNVLTWYDAHAHDPQPEELELLIAEADWLVDGLMGTGLTRPVEGAMRTVVEAMNRSGKPILALDLPSGLDADKGIALGVAIKAQATATFVAPKLGFAAPGAVDYTGEVAVIDIGLPRSMLEPFLLQGLPRMP